LYACTVCWYLAPGGADPYEPQPVEQRHGYYVVPQLMAGNCKVLACTGGDVQTQQMAHFGAGKWRDDDQLWWTHAKPGAKLDLALSVAKAGAYEVIVFLTKARDYGIVQFQLDGKKAGEPVDLYNPKVIPSGPVSLGIHDLSAGEHRLRVEIVGANEQAVKSYMFGLDYVDLKAK
ncbi:MAG: hypothetical protein N2689_14120, partial [Verrucomicrobiae bacterium]|nr:hypothetical protein [Verrucomicrobiae bacterium]